MKSVWKTKSFSSFLFLIFLFNMSQKNVAFAHPSDLQPELELRLKSIEQLYFQASTFIHQFDTTLDAHQNDPSSSGFIEDVFNSGTYPNLLFLRDQLDQSQNEIIELIRKSIEILNEPAPDLVSLQEQEKARLLIKSIGNYYQNLPSSLLMAHDAVALSVEELEIQDLDLKLGIERILHAQPVEEENIPLQFPIDFKVQLQKISPSTGSSGNITGNRFPTGVWSLTFDDGPHSRYSPQVLKNLLNAGMKATFFMLAQQVKLYPQLALNIQEAGMEIGNHSYTHAQLSKVSYSRLKHEVSDSQEVFQQVLGKRPKLFRLPYGAGVHLFRVRGQLAEERLIHVFWNVDSLDWHDRNPGSIVARVKKQMALSSNQGGVILFHDIHPQSVEASRMIMQYFQESNEKDPGHFQIMTIGEAIELKNLE